uniref:Calcium load-activated calcium channel n=1 Tax=Timema tahoe TaxID=61484 RepID=A0A7R9IE29_9NEOP|nr:unnamed protein product [Timema tahoe]
MVALMSVTVECSVSSFWQTGAKVVHSPHGGIAGCYMEKRKEAHGDSLDKQHKKKIEREEEKLKNNNRDLSFVKMKSMFAIGFAFTALLSMFNSIFDGRVVARLPFIPISWIQGLSHRNLPGDDYSECSFIFLYILCTMAIRQVRRSVARGVSHGHQTGKQYRSKHNNHTLDTAASGKDVDASSRGRY